MNEKLIKKLAAGEIAVKNDGTLEQLREVLKAAFTEDDSETNGNYNYYFMHSQSAKTWDCVNHTTIPSHPISDFYTEDQPEFVRGEVVEVRDMEADNWQKRIYLTKIEGSTHPYICVVYAHEDRFKLNKEFDIIYWRQIRKLEPVVKHIEVTRNEIAAWKGCKPEQIVIV